jgi:sterol desaturase/sphingolipid hydroxylase (fatty acid hydroxylase superfamily)
MHPWRNPTNLEAFRAEQLTKVPSWYVPLMHLGGTTSIGIIALLGIYWLENTQLWEYLAIPFLFIFANLFEWWAHKFLLHKEQKAPTWLPKIIQRTINKLFHALFHNHTPSHHRMFVYGDMAINKEKNGWNGLYFVLIPLEGIIGVVLTALPLAFGLGFLISTNVGLLTGITQSIYVVSYELLHLCYHLPVNHPIGKLKIIKKLKRHHELHHAPELMQTHNFNVTIPAADELKKTNLSESEILAFIKKYQDEDNAYYNHIIDPDA